MEGGNYEIYTPAFFSRAILEPLLAEHMLRLTRSHMVSYHSNSVIPNEAFFLDTHCYILYQLSLLWQRTGGKKREKKTLKVTAELILTQNY